MKYEKPAITILDEFGVTEWAISKKKSLEHPVRVLDSSRTNPAKCNCTSSGSRVSYRKPEVKSA